MSQDTAMFDKRLCHIVTYLVVQLAVTEVTEVHIMLEDITLRSLETIDQS